MIPAKTAGRLEAMAGCGFASNPPSEFFIRVTRWIKYRVEDVVQPLRSRFAQARRTRARGARRATSLGV